MHNDRNRNGIVDQKFRTSSGGWCRDAKIQFRFYSQILELTFQLAEIFKRRVRVSEWWWRWCWWWQRLDDGAIMHHHCHCHHHITQCVRVGGVSGSEWEWAKESETLWASEWKSECVGVLSESARIYTTKVHFGDQCCSISLPSKFPSCSRVTCNFFLTRECFQFVTRSIFFALAKPRFC